MNNTGDKEKILPMLTTWLVGKGLQCKVSNLAQGGISRGYSRIDRKYEFAYTEITGYAVSFLTDLAISENQEPYQEKIQGALDYLLKMQQLAEGSADEGAFCHSVDLENGEARYDFYSFDAAMCIQGLVDYYSATGKNIALKSAVRSADWLINKMQFPDGSFRAISSIGDKKTEVSEDPLFGDQCCLHAKLAIGLLKVWKASQDVRYREAAVKVCDWVIQLQNPNGSFRTSVRSTQIMSHTHSYAVEGLIYAAYVLNDDRYLTTARKGGEWLAKKQNKNGSLNIGYNRSVFRLRRRVIELIRPKYVADATSQAIRIWLLLDRINKENYFTENCQRAARFLEEMQVIEAVDINTEGGIQYCPGHPIIYAWVNMFAHQALRWLTNDDGKPVEKMVESLF